jgi:hypothetical protein
MLRGTRARHRPPLPEWRRRFGRKPWCERAVDTRRAGKRHLPVARGSSSQVAVLAAGDPGTTRAPSRRAPMAMRN